MRNLKFSVRILYIVCAQIANMPAATKSITLQDAKPSLRVTFHRKHFFGISRVDSRIRHKSCSKLWGFHQNPSTRSRLPLAPTESLYETPSLRVTCPLPMRVSLSTRQSHLYESLRRTWAMLVCVSNAILHFWSSSTLRNRSFSWQCCMWDLPRLQSWNPWSTSKLQTLRSNDPADEMTRREITSKNNWMDARGDFA